MRIDKASHAVGGWTMILMGLAHLAGHIHGHTAEHSAEEQKVLDAMEGLPLGAPGSTTLADIFSGFSLTFTVLSLLIGALALILLRPPSDRPGILRPVRILLVGFLGIETILSAIWFLPPPTVFLAVATAAFFVSLLTTGRSEAPGP